MSLAGHAREMRKAPTRSENLMWRVLRDRRFSGFKFRRQHPVGRYILDFYCAELKLAIEMDGAPHTTDWLAERDKIRDQDLRHLGIEVLRIPNEVLITDFHAAADWIHAAIERRR